jgi:hypothetical protein
MDLDKINRQLMSKLSSAAANKEMDIMDFESLSSYIGHNSLYANVRNITLLSEESLSIIDVVLLWA